MTSREISKAALRILMTKDDKERTLEENTIINNALTIWEQSGKLWKVADLLISRL